MDPRNRITKDTSARKNNLFTGVDSAIETAAVIASREAYISSIVEGYQQKIATMESEQQAVVNDAVQKAIANSSSQMQKSEETIAELKRALSESKGEVAEVRRSMEQKTVSFQVQIARLNKQLEVGPNSWIQFNVTGKGRKMRTYVRRPHASFTEALEELAKDSGKFLPSMKFKVSGSIVAGSDKRQLLHVRSASTLKAVPRSS